MPPKRLAWRARTRERRAAPPSRTATPFCRSSPTALSSSPGTSRGDFSRPRDAPGPRVRAPSSWLRASKCGARHLDENHKSHEACRLSHTGNGPGRFPDPRERLPVARRNPLPELRSRDHDGGARRGLGRLREDRARGYVRLVARPRGAPHGGEPRRRRPARAVSLLAVRFPRRAAAGAHPVRERQEDRHAHARRRAPRVRGRGSARVLEEGGERAQVRLRVRRVSEGSHQRRGRRAHPFGRLRLARNPAAPASPEEIGGRPSVSPGTGGPALFYFSSTSRLLLVYRHVRGDEVRIERLHEPVDLLNPGVFALLPRDASEAIILTLRLD